ncbi:MAG: hypothetical protein C0522_15145, partial [Rhodocyclaceae bacterium]|nr:hypothetical protein [Rhodocyclaceae bacterium]
MRSISLALGLVLLGAADAAAQNVYFGNLHAHTAYSDGTGTPAEAFAAARSAGLDFLAVTEHNHDKADGSKTRKDGVIIATRPELYAGSRRSLLAASDKSNRSAGFVALYGQEVSTISSGNHINVFDVAEVIRAPNGDVPALLAWSSAHPASSGGSAVMQFNHPRGGVGEKKDYGKDDYATERDWVAALDPHVELIEILNAPALKDGTGFRAHHHEREYFGYLNLGFHLAPSVGHDNHYTNWGRSTD